MSNTRYYVYSKRTLDRTGEAKVLKNAVTREAAREYKRTKSDPTAYGIMDRWTGETIR